MRRLIAALGAGAVFWPAILLADTISLKVTGPKDGYQARYDASWQKTPATAERYWLCNRPLWVPAGVGAKVSRLYQHGYQVELVAGGADTADAKRVICTLTDPAESAQTKKAPAGVGDRHGN